MTFIKLLLGVIAFLAVPFEASAQSVQDLMNEALKIPSVRDAMRGRVPQVRSAKDPSVLEMQTLLNARGFSVGTPDGIAGPGTRRAIAAFQQSINRAPTGNLSEEELALLRSDAGTARSTTAATLKQPEPVDIRLAQSNLADLGYDPGPVDGAWGKRSQTALDQFRQDHNSSDKGNPSAEDMALMQSELSHETAPQILTDADGTEPELFALPIVDRGAEFRVVWEAVSVNIKIGVIPLWSDGLPDVTHSGPQPVSLRAPDKPGLYHIVMIDAERKTITKRTVLEIR